MKLKHQVSNVFVGIINFKDNAIDKYISYVNTNYKFFWVIIFR